MSEAVNPAAVVAELADLPGAVMAWWGSATGSAWVLVRGGRWALLERLAEGRLIERGKPR